MGLVFYSSIRNERNDSLAIQLAQAGFLRKKNAAIVIGSRRPAGRV